MTTLQKQEDKKKYCRDCARWQLLSRHEKQLMGILVELPVGRCLYDDHLSEGYYACIDEDEFEALNDHTCANCGDDTCPRYGMAQQGCPDWRPREE